MKLLVERLCAGYGGARIVSDLDLYVDAGEVVTLLGPNGAGKTTSLLTIAGFLRVMSGSVLVDGRRINGVAPFRLARRGMTMISDDRSLLPSLTVAENLALVREKRRDPIEMFPVLENLMQRRAGLLSGGEQQMLGLARAFASEPNLLLVDELSHGLAPVILASLFPLLRRAADEWGAAVLLVEQNIAGALSVADRGYVMHGGRLIISDTPASELLMNKALVDASYLGEAALRDAIPHGGSD